MLGTQPAVGTMSWRLDSRLSLVGHPDSFTIVMSFRFPKGVDASGEPYRGRSQRLGFGSRAAGREASVFAA